jgi:hypothetical protein
MLKAGVKRPLGRPRRSWKDNIKTDLKEMGLGGMDKTDIVQDTYK